MNYNTLIRKIKPLLTDEIKLKRFIGEDHSHVSKFEEPVEISPCKVERELQFSISGNDEGSSDIVTVFLYNVFTSGISVSPKDVVVFKEKEYTVRKVTTLDTGLEIEGVLNGES